jgi:acyl-CoA thioesterase FadM
MYEVVHASSERLVARGKTVMVSYDYEKAVSVPLPPATRDLLQRVKGSDPGLTQVRP